MGYVAGPKEFYDGLASEYHVLFEDWWRAAMWHGGVIASLLAARGVGEHSRVLDCTCGIGTQALPLAVLGYHVTGTDLSQRSVERARMEARARGLQIDLEVADVRTVRKVVEGHFDAVISCDNALSHLLTEADLDEAIDNVRACLRGGGLLIASVRDYDALAIARPTGIPIALHGPSGERQGTGQPWVWSPAGDQLEITLFTLGEGPNRAWDAANQEKNPQGAAPSEVNPGFGQHGFEAVHW